MRKPSMNKQQIRTILLHEFRLGHTAAVATRNINEGFGHGTVKARTVRRWFLKFRNGDTSLQEKEGRGPKSQFDNEKLKALVEANPKTTIRKLAKEMEVSFTTVHRHLREIGKRKKQDKWVPYGSNLKKR